MAQPQHILIAANPKSGAVSRKALLDSLRDALIDDNFAVDVCTNLDQVEQQAAELHNASRLRAVVSAGGDGTAAALANRITAEIPLLIFPLGTENLLAKHLGMNNDISTSRERLRASRSIALDVGLANNKMFLVMASCGFDAAVVEDMHANRKGHINRWSYTKPILRTLRRYRFPLARLIENDDALTCTREQQAAWTFIFNVPRYAANLQFCPQANPLDGKLDVCTFRKPGMLKGFGYLTSLWFGKHHGMNEFSHSVATNISIVSSEVTPPHEIPYQLDGDPGGVLPLDIRVLPGRLKVIV